MVCPATTDTAMVSRFAERWPEYQKKANASYPLGRIATAEGSCPKSKLFLQK